MRGFGKKALYANKKRLQGVSFGGVFLEWI